MKKIIKKIKYSIEAIKSMSNKDNLVSIEWVEQNGENILNEILDIIYEYLGINKDKEDINYSYNFKFKSGKNNTLGVYEQTKIGTYIINTVNINMINIISSCRVNTNKSKLFYIEQLINTLTHELTHYVQYRDNSEILAPKSYRYNSEQTYDEYYNQIHEKDARDRASLFIDNNIDLIIDLYRNYK